MKRIAALFLLLVIAMPAAAVEDGDVMYSGGTVPGLASGAIGRLDTASETSLTFQSSGATLVIPYAKIDSFEYTEQVARHLGVLPAIAVGLVKARQHKHFIRISFHGENPSLQVAVFEVPKQMPQSLLAILRSRAPQACNFPLRAMCGRAG
jgi:hypothetical protein